MHLSHTQAFRHPCLKCTARYPEQKTTIQEKRNIAGAKIPSIFLPLFAWLPLIMPLNDIISKCNTSAFRFNVQNSKHAAFRFNVQSSKHNDNHQIWDACITEFKIEIKARLTVVAWQQSEISCFRIQVQSSSTKRNRASSYARTHGIRRSNSRSHEICRRLKLKEKKSRHLCFRF